MLKRHARAKGTDDGRRAIEEINAFETQRRHTLADPELLRLRATNRPIPPRAVAPQAVFDDYLNGFYFHEDEERLARIGTGLLGDLHRFLFLQTFRSLAVIYVNFSAGPLLILAEPSLQPS
jgi:hypothetical protein